MKTVCSTAFPDRPCVSCTPVPSPGRHGLFSVSNWRFFEVNFLERQAESFSILRKKNNTSPRMGASDVWDPCITAMMDPHRVWTLARFARSLIGSALRGSLRATLREALRFVGANMPVRCRLRSISLRCYVIARSAVLSADTRRLRAAPLARSLPLPICRLRASPCRAEGAKGAHPPYQVCCPLAVLLKQNRMRRPSLPNAARARLRPC